MRIGIRKRIGTFINRRIRIVKVVDIHTIFLDFDFLCNKVASSIFAVVIKVARFAARRAGDTKVIRQIKRNRISKKRGVSSIRNKQPRLRLLTTLKDIGLLIQLYLIGFLVAVCPCSVATTPNASDFLIKIRFV